jgi:hypothetical protein
MEGEERTLSQGRAGKRNLDRCDGRTRRKSESPKGKAGLNVEMKASKKDGRVKKVTETGSRGQRCGITKRTEKQGIAEQAERNGQEVSAGV